MPRYVRSRDIVWLNFTPKARHEQMGHRPALVLCPASYNDKTKGECFTYAWHFGDSQPGKIDTHGRSQ
jgi:hypothetical protein